MQSQPDFSPSPDARRLPTVDPFATYLLVGVIVVIWVLTELTGGTKNLQHMVDVGANWAPLVTQGEYWRLFTANWLHFGVQHVLLNAFSLYSLGSQVESLFGRRRFLAIYLLSGVSGALASYVLTHGLSAGASTAVFGLLGALGVYFYRQRAVIGAESRSRLQNLLIVLVLNIVYGVAAGGIDNWGHAGGLLGGLVLGWFFCPRYARTDGVVRRDAELTTPWIVDENSLGKNWPVVLLFIAAMVVITIWASSALRMTT